MNPYDYVLERDEALAFAAKHLAGQKHVDPLPENPTDDDLDRVLAPYQMRVLRYLPSGEPNPYPTEDNSRCDWCRGKAQHRKGCPLRVQAVIASPPRPPRK